MTGICPLDGVPHEADMVVINDFNQRVVNPSQHDYANPVQSAGSK